MQISTLFAWRPAGSVFAPSKTAPRSDTVWANWEWSARIRRESRAAKTIMSSSRDTVFPVWAWRKLPCRGGEGEGKEGEENEVKRKKKECEERLKHHQTSDYSGSILLQKILRLCHVLVDVRADSFISFHSKTGLLWSGTLKTNLGWSF